MSRRIVVMRRGVVVEQGPATTPQIARQIAPAEQIFACPQTEYTQALLAAALKLEVGASPQVRTDAAAPDTDERNGRKKHDGPVDRPCGTCGNDTREGAEACDGAASDGLRAPGVCRPDCTCAPPPECSATIGGRWFFGNNGESCDTACANEFRAYDPATEFYAGSGGSDANCLAVLNALGGMSVFTGPARAAAPLWAAC